MLIFFFSNCLTTRFDPQTLTPPPSLLTSYIPELILASNTFLEHCSRDPTAYGISTAFLQSSAQLEHALVAYCGIVGNIFATKRANRRKLTRSRRSSGAVDESKRSPPPSDIAPWPLSRGSFNYPSTPQLSLFGIPDKRKSMPVTSNSGLDISCPFPTEEPPSSSVPPPPAECESPQDPKTNPRRSLSLFRRMTMTCTQPTSPVPFTPKSTKSSWPRFRSSSKTSVQGLANSNEVIESPPRQINRVPPRPTRPIPAVPQDESPRTSESSEPNKRADTRRYHNRSASLQETHTPPAEPPSFVGWNTSNPMRRGGTSLDLNHAIGSAESSTRSSHNIHFETEERRERVPTVRDLAILPAQRVMRYVLLFKG